MARKPPVPAPSTPTPLIIDQAFRRQTIESEQRVPNVVITALSRNKFAIVASMPAGSADIRCEDQIAVTDKKLDDRDPMPSRAPRQPCHESTEGQGVRFSAVFRAVCKPRAGISCPSKLR